MLSRWLEHIMPHLDVFGIWISASELSKFELRRGKPASNPCADQCAIDSFVDVLPNYSAVPKLHSTFSSRKRDRYIYIQCDYSYST